jgi:hypothetical protein
MTENKAREREGWGEKHGGEREGELRGLFEKMAWVDFDHWSKSTTPENFLKTSIK